MQNHSYTQIVEHMVIVRYDIDLQSYFRKMVMKRLELGYLFNSPERKRKQKILIPRRSRYYGP